MKLAYAMLADAAQATPDGKVSMLGGDFDTIFALKFPATHSSLALVLRFEFERRECGLEHRLRVSSTAPLGAPFLPVVESAFTPQLAPGAEDRPIKALIVLNFQGLSFPTQGKYQFQVSVDGRPMGTVPLYLARLSQSDVRTLH